MMSEAEAWAEFDQMIFHFGKIKKQFVLFLSFFVQNHTSVLKSILCWPVLHVQVVTFDPSILLSIQATISGGNRENENFKKDQSP